MHHGSGQWILEECGNQKILSIYQIHVLKSSSNEKKYSHEIYHGSTENEPNKDIQFEFIETNVCRFAVISRFTLN